MWRLTAVLAVLSLVVAGCGSDDKSGTTAKNPGQTTTSGELPPVQGKEGKGGTTNEPAPARKGKQVQVTDFLAFKTPSGKIGCATTKDPTTLRCDTKYETSFSRSGHRCQEGDYGHSFEVDQSGAGKAICAGDTVLSATNARTIPYGKTWLLGPFSCTAQQSGLTCRNGQGHGFALSVERQRVF